MIDLWGSIFRRDHFRTLESGEVRDDRRVGVLPPKMEGPFAEPRLWKAAANGRVERVRQLLAGGADMEERGGVFESNPLHMAARRGQVDVVGMLLEAGANLSSTYHNGETPLHCAARHGRHAVIMLLLCKGANVFSKNNQGWMALHGAACSGHDAVVRALIKHGVDVSAKTHDGLTAEDLATAHSHIETAEALKAEAERRAKCEAFATGQHPRLGERSQVLALDVGVVRMVLDQV